MTPADSLANATTLGPDPNDCPDVVVDAEDQDYEAVSADKTAEEVAWLYGLIERLFDGDTNAREKAEVLLRRDLRRYQEKAQRRAWRRYRDSFVGD